jgi:flavin-dependent dehydrogenase
MRKAADVRIGIVGGGPAGSAAALALLDQGFQCSIIEKSSYSDFRIGEHLLPSARSLLGRLGMLEEMENCRNVGCPGVRSAWGGSALEDMDYLFNPHGGGFNLSRPEFDANLANTAVERGAELLVETKLTSASLQSDGWNVELNSQGKRVPGQFDFLVDASGRASALATRLGAKRISHDKLIGLTGFLSSSEPTASADDTNQENMLLLESSEDGWWYCASLSNHRIVVTYMTDAEKLKNDRPLALWSLALKSTKHVRDYCQSYHDPQEVHVRSARTQRLNRMAGKGWLAIGDAAYSFDPLSSAGISKGLSSGLHSAEVIKSYFSGNERALENYCAESVRDFDEYLIERAGYYRLETQWPNASFWRRRQKPLAVEQPITLDPEAHLYAAETWAPGGVFAASDEYLPGVNSALLSSLASTPTPAHQLISLYQVQTEKQNSDRDVIAVLQMLIDDNQLLVQTNSRFNGSQGGSVP